MPPHCYWTKMRLWSLESGGSFQRSPYCVGGWRGPAGHCCPEERALSWTDGSSVTAPHSGGKRFPFSSLLRWLGSCEAGKGWVRCGAVAGGHGGRVRVQRGVGHVKDMCIYLRKAALPLSCTTHPSHSLSIVRSIKECHTFFTFYLWLKGRRGRSSWCLSPTHI